MSQKRSPSREGLLCKFRKYYRFIALAPKTPAKAEATAITTFRIISQTDFFIAIIYLLSVSLNSCVTLCSSVLTAPIADSPNSLDASKHGHCLIHSSGSISPFPFKSGERSRCPHTRQPGKRSSKSVTSCRSVARCAGVRVSAGCPRQSRPPS